MKSSFSWKLPQHIAVVMDGNGRWAKQHGLPRIAGHRAGVESVRKIVQGCLEYKIPYLTIFAFSSENWQRPIEEVQFLMELFTMVLKQEVRRLHRSGVRLKFIGDRSKFEPALKGWVEKSENLTQLNTKLILTIALNYGGQWDIVQATKKIAQKIIEKKLSLEAITSELVEENLSLGTDPAPDLFIRTSGEQRISNFLLWHLAYAELYFTQKHWPDFDETEFNLALEYYQLRERRFGCIGEQLQVQQKRPINSSHSKEESA